MRGILPVVLLAATAMSAGAQSARYTTTSTSSVTVEGTSNIHAWHATSAQLTTAIQLASPISAGSNVESVTLSLPVTSLKSGKGGLDKNLYKALHADRHPTITFVMKTYKAVPEGDAYAAVITGMLAVNGVEKEIVASARLTGETRSGVKATGSATFNMTEFGVKPVTALMGTIRTGNSVTVKFDLTGTPAQAVAALPQQ